jgi:RNA polymerase sigma-70 factor, ECF subfamily
MGEDAHEAATRITAMLGTGGAGSSAAELAPLVYDSLRRLAASQLAGEGADAALQPTALVHEVYLRLVDQTRVEWRGRTHFFAIGAEMLRRVLVDAARARKAQKRGGGWDRVTLSGAAELAGTEAADVAALDDALRELKEADERAARVVELRFFGGLGDAEIAEVLGVSERTVRNDWRMARAWLRRTLSGEKDSGEKDSGETGVETGDRP